MRQISIWRGLRQEPAGKRFWDEKKGNSDKWVERTRKTPIRYGLVVVVVHNGS